MHSAFHDCYEEACVVERAEYALEFEDYSHVLGKFIVEGEEDLSSLRLVRINHQSILDNHPVQIAYCLAEYASIPESVDVIRIELTGLLEAIQCLLNMTALTGTSVS